MRIPDSQGSGGTPPAIPPGAQGNRPPTPGPSTASAGHDLPRPPASAAGQSTSAPAQAAKRDELRALQQQAQERLARLEQRRTREQRQLHAETRAANASFSRARATILDNAAIAPQAAAQWADEVAGTAARMNTTAYIGLAAVRANRQAHDAAIEATKAPPGDQMPAPPTDDGDEPPPPRS